MSNRRSHFVHRLQTPTLQSGRRVRLKQAPGAPADRCAGPDSAGGVDKEWNSKWMTGA